MASHVFKAIEAGTLGDPYRYVNKDEIVHLTDAEAELHKDSKWLKPKAVADAMPVPPLMPHFRNVRSNDALTALSQLQTPIDPALQVRDAMNVPPQVPFVSPGDFTPPVAPVVDNGGFNPAADETNSGNAAGQGTSNQDVLG